MNKADLVAAVHWKLHNDKLITECDVSYLSACAIKDCSANFRFRFSRNGGVVRIPHSTAKLNACRFSASHTLRKLCFRFQEKPSSD